MADFVNADILNGEGWDIKEPSFLAWTSPGQPSTVPLYYLNTPTDRLAYLISSDGIPPTLSGFETGRIIGYVYPTQICGSVPLYGAAFSATGTHWYTTNLNDHNSLVSLGWVDAGVTAYVLPLEA